MRSLSLQVEPVPGLEALGDCELREQGWWHVRGLIQQAAREGVDAELVVLGVTLFVDGEPIGAEALRELPGRFATPLSKALGRAMVMYSPPEEAPADEAGGTTPGES